MDAQDKSEKRAEYRNARQGSQGKGYADNRTSRKAYSQGYEGIDWGKKGGDKTVIVTQDDKGFVAVEGIFIEDVYNSDKFHNDYTFEGERIRVITLCYDGDYRVQFDDKPTIKLDKWAICKEVGK